MNRRMLLKGSAIAMLGAMNKMAIATEVEGETAKTQPDSAPLENELEKYPRCVICNMDRRQYHYARHLRWSRSFGQPPGWNKLRPVPGFWF